MAKRAVAFRQTAGGTDVTADSILNALASAIIVVNGAGAIVHVNSAAENFLQGGAEHLKGRALLELLPNDNPLFSLIQQVRDRGFAISEYGVTLESPRIGKHFVNLHASPLAEDPKSVVVTLQQRSIADKIDRQLTHRGAARSVTAMAAMLAHEVKNPVSYTHLTLPTKRIV